MPKSASPPLFIIVDCGHDIGPDYAKRATDCDGGDCACDYPGALPPTVAGLDSNKFGSVGASDVAVRVVWGQQYRAHFNTQTLDSEHTFCYHPEGRGTVLSTSALALASWFTQPGRPDALPTIWRTIWGDAAINTILCRLLAARLLVPVDQPLATPTTQPTTLTVWLHLTDRCNLRCGYCYLTHQCVSMSLETGQAAIDTALRSATANGFSTIQIKYAGGEPLIAWRVIPQLHRYACDHAASLNIDIRGVVLSNGTLLTKEIAETITSLNIGLALSLDALGSMSSPPRPYADGRDSTVDVVRAVDLAQATGMRLSLMVTVGGQSSEDLAAVVAFALARHLPFSLNFARPHGRTSVSPADSEQLIKAMLRAYQEIETALPHRSLLATLLDRANLSAPHAHACGAGTSSLVFDWEGRVGDCQMRIYSPLVAAGNHDPLIAIASHPNRIHNISVGARSGCGPCLWRAWCAGGCPLATYHSSGRYDASSPFCTVYKALFPAVLRLEGLRLIAHGRVINGTSV